MRVGQVIIGLAGIVCVRGDSASDDGGQLLKCRSSPSSSGLVVAALADGDVLDIECQTHGTSVRGSPIWHRTDRGCFVSDHFMSVSSEFEPQCSSVDATRACTGIAAQGLQLIEQHTGFVARPRADVSGRPTIGFGHTCEAQNCAEVPVSLPVSQIQARELLRMDVRNATVCLAQSLGSITLNANQWASLVSWTLDVGCNMAASSQLVARLNHGEPASAVAAHELPRWTIFRGKQRDDLVSRRSAELALFQTQSLDTSYPHCVIRN
ncbi:hypothetical protein IWW56_004244 [Coemansia sp. RSA 2131]|nr:hypothetical protein IWW56_004244 [Coemansia sp. RSA 2131]